jgi:hypothetical protein
MHPSILGAGVIALAAALACAAAGAAPGCAAPARVVERFIDADCERCWRTPEAAAPPASAWVLDWIAPSARGDEAALSPAALPEAAARLAALARSAPPPDDTLQADWPLAASAPITLRVEAGPAWNGYFGLQLRARGKPPAGAQAFLALTEELPAGAEGSPVARRLVRSVAGPLALADTTRELRALRIPEGAQPERLRAVAWWVDARGAIRGVASESCR